MHWLVVHNWLVIQLLFCLVIDINECGSANGGCNHYCNNTDGSYHCSCITGFILTSDQHNCTGLMKFFCVFVIFMQTSMSAMKLMQTVIKFAQILLVATTVAVRLDFII